MAVSLFGISASAAALLSCRQPPPPQLSGRAAPTALSYGGMISSPFPGSPLSSWNSGRFTFWVYLRDSVVIINAEAKRRDLIRLHYIYLEYYWSHGSVFGSIFITRWANRHSALIKRRRVQTWRSTWAAWLNGVADIHLVGNSRSRSTTCICSIVANSALYLISSQTPKTPHLWLQHFICYTVIHIFP